MSHVIYHNSIFISLEMVDEHEYTSFSRTLSEMMSFEFSIAGEFKEASKVVLECGPIGIKELDLCRFSLTRKTIPIQIIAYFSTWCNGIH
jgi:hypothetical protein